VTGITTRTLTLSDQEGVLGTITLQGDQLTGSTPVLQMLADKQLRTSGSAEAAYTAISQISSGYVTARPS
jgi:hypothetical protein